VDAVLQRNVRNSSLVVTKEKRTFLTYPAKGLVHCALEEKEDSVNFLFDTNGIVSAETIYKKPQWEQFRFLINCADLECLDIEYNFSLSLDNLMVDINLIPQLLLRDANESRKSDFLQRYKALIGSVLFRKYKYENYLEGGQDHYNKKKLLKEISKLETVNAVRNHLFDEYQNLIFETEETKKLVPKKNVWITRIFIPLLSTILLVSIFFGGRMFFIDIPFRNNVISASMSYINGDPLGVQRALANYDVTQLSQETRRFLSRSYVSTEPLTDSQIANILVGLAERTDPIIFDFWIFLGRLQFYDAIDIAQRVNDDQLLLYAYQKYEAFIRQDTTMLGAERADLLNYLERNIDTLIRVREEVIMDALISP